MNTQTPLEIEVLKILLKIKPGQTDKANRVKELLRNEIEYNWNIKGEQKTYQPKNPECALQVLGEALINSTIEKFTCKDFVNFKILAPYLKKSKIKILILECELLSSSDHSTHLDILANNLPPNMHTLEFINFKPSHAAFRPLITILPDLNLHTLQIYFAKSSNPVFCDENFIEALSQTLPKTQLTHLGLTGNRLTKNSLNNLSENLYRSKITRLNLSNNFNFGRYHANYNHEIIQDVIKLIERTPELSEIILNGCGFNQQDLGELTKTLKKSKIKVLGIATFAYSEANGSDLLLLAKELPGLPFYSLDISGYKFLKKDAIAFSENIITSSLSTINTTKIHKAHAPIIDQAVKANIKYQQQLHLNAREALDPFLVQDTIHIVESFLTLNPDLKPSNSDILKPAFKVHQQKKKKVVTDNYTQKYSKTKRKKS